MGPLTVIIPTFNRKTVLQKALEGYFAQSAPEGIHELLIVDDGSTDGTAAVVDQMVTFAPFPVRYLDQNNAGPATARNRGIREARSRIILFTDSDIVPERDLVAQHLEWHDRHPQDNVAVLGYVTWPSEPEPTPFMKWYGETHLFAYRQLRNKQRIDSIYLYSCNLSLKTDFLRTWGQFDEEFKTAAYEDVELGYRLGKAGLQLLYNRKAVAYHHQFFLFGDACRKLDENVAATRTFLKKEAGQQFLEAQRKRKSRLTYRIGKLAATAVAPVLNLARRLLDSDIPLPSIVYRLCFWYFASSRAE